MDPAGTNTNLHSVKEKTKAKQRYLKKKKERRKLKPKQRSDDKQDKEKNDEDVMEVDIEEANTTTPSDNQKNPRKRTLAEAEVTVDDEEMIEIEEPLARSRTPELQGALPSFPLPALPDAPSKSLLAFQGLDQALVGAELVSPSTILPIPTEKDDGGTRLSERMRKRLRDLGITELFAVQTALLPFLLPEDEQAKGLYLPFSPPRDVCVSAPTGSGKTLAYVLPIIEALSSRIVTRLRALIVLPTRDLVAQVRETIETLSKGTKLKIGTATGQHSFAHEQSQLIQDQTSDLLGGSSKIDILICTPGRLIDHITGTPNFSLQHLRFLVIDEADRLLAQSFQDWLSQVLAATRPHSKNLSERPPSTAMGEILGALGSYPLNNIVPDGIAPAFLHRLVTPTNSFFLEPKSFSCQKLLFSATLTRDPGKITALELKNPKYFIVQSSGEKKTADSAVLDVVMEKFSMPSTLKEHMIVCSSTQKPLVFFHLVHHFDVKNALVFTKSAESTTRLVRLFDFFESERAKNLGFEPIVVRSYSSDLPVNERKSILEMFKNQRIHILVCSDLISRGIDISHVSHVVSYDVPVDMRKYVHRVGRTARAGRDGDAWTLVEEQEARYFKQMLKGADHFERVKRIRLSEKDLAPLLPHYEVALNQLKDAYSRQS
ncbi:P-loop containing nucleoside triphosphate hydrolase protein [Pholiota conissans]|uniref:ATP-dependent RNA helicase n=1 Tax=Pholiota conissans TaxID=109636 RepID=A0A9P5ZED2_9AGAR|nr:P-loop containing nucleoside triphosphate hydrolase protein [Pholiota conissans]